MAKKAQLKKAPAKKVAVKKAPAKKAPAKKAPETKTSGTKVGPTKTVAKETAAKETAAKAVAPKVPAKKVPAKVPIKDEVKETATTEAPVTPTVRPSTLSVAPEPPAPKKSAAKQKKIVKISAAEAEETAKLKQKWEGLFARASQLETRPYSMRENYEPQTAIEHKSLGWGFILNVQNNRLEVLFQDGIKMLISNYK